MPHLRVLFLVIVAVWMVISRNAHADQASDSLLADELTSELVCLPSRDVRPLKDTLQKLFVGADTSRLIQLADNPDLNVAMWARWELRRTLFSHSFDANSRYFPVRFLELKGIDVPVAWAKQFAIEFLPAETLRLQAVRYYREHATKPSQMSFIATERSTYVHYTNADVPAGTTVRESDADLVVKQSEMAARLEKPLTQNFYAMNTSVRGVDAFLPLVTKDKTFVLSLRGLHMMPFVLCCFGTKSGSRSWETVGWSGLPIKVDVVPRNLLPASFETALLRTAVGEIKCSGPETDPGRGGKGQFSGTCSLYLVRNEGLVTVFGSEGILFVEAFDVKTGRNVLRFSTDYNGEEADAAADQIQLDEGALRRAIGETKGRKREGR